MRNHHRTGLEEIFNVTDLVSIYYYELNQFRYSQEHSLNCWQLHCEIKGTKNIKLNGETYNLKAGQIAFISPDTKRQIQNKYGYNDSAICAFECHSPAMKFFENKIITLNDDETDLFLKTIYLGSNFFERVDTPSIYGMRTVEDTPPGVLHALKIYLELFLISVYHRLTDVSTSVNLLNMNLEAGSAKIVTDIKEYFGAHVNEKLTISMLADHFKLSPTTLKTSFKKVTGQSLMDYFMNIKIKKAKSLIRSGEYTLSQISDLLEFSSPTYFSSAFKKITGETPSEFAKQFNLEKTHAKRNLAEY